MGLNEKLNLFHIFILNSIDKAVLWKDIEGNCALKALHMLFSLQIKSALCAAFHV